MKVICIKDTVSDNGRHMFKTGMVYDSHVNRDHKVIIYDDQISLGNPCITTISTNFINQSFYSDFVNHIIKKLLLEV